MTQRFSRRSSASAQTGASTRRASALLFSSRNPRLRAVAHVLLATWLCPLLLSLLAVFGAQPAQAQPVQGPLESTVVLDFSVPNGVDPVVGRKAADALAVELQRSGSYDVKTRQEVETATQSTPGLTPPYNTATQANLARAVQARSVFSGRVTSVQPQQGRSARVQIEVRQLEASTEDYINGTLISEISSVALTDRPTEVLVDEAINKAAVSAVRSLGQTQLPRGNVLNVTTNDVELNIGARNGVFPGQRFSVLRDVANRATGRIERVKVGEVTITRVEADQSTAVVSGGAQGGVTTNDRVRRIYDLNNIAVSAGARNGDTSVTPVTARPERVSNGGPVKKAGKGLLGILGLVVGVAVLGLGGGGSTNGSPKSVTAYRGIPSDPVDGYINNSNAFSGDIRLTWTSGASGLDTDARNIAGYFVYRTAVDGSSGINSGLSPNANTLQGFVAGNTRAFGDNSPVTFGREITVTSNGQSANVTRNNGVTAKTALSIAALDASVTADFNQNVPFSGFSYIYAVQRVTLVNGTGTTGTPNGNGGTATNKVLELSKLSSTSGRVTALAGPDIVGNSFNFDNLQVGITANFNPGGTVPTPTPNPTPVTNPTATPAPISIYGNNIEFTAQLSVDRNFPRGDTNRQNFPVTTTPAVDVNGNLLLTFGPVTVPKSDGTTPVFIRVGARNPNDEPGRRTPYVYGPSVQFTPSTGTTTRAVGSRLLNSSGPTRGADGLGLPGLFGGGIGASRNGLGGSGGPRRPGRGLRPR